MNARDKHRREIIKALRRGADVHESMARLCGRDEGAEAYHLDMARAMREAAELLTREEG